MDLSVDYNLSLRSYVSGPPQVVSKLGLLDTSRTAWESDDHDAVWKGMSSDYELEHRFENLIKKLDIYKEESRFILEV